LFADSCGESCVEVMNLGLHDSMLELRSASASAVHKILAEISYEDAGGFYVESLAQSLKDVFQQSIQIYDDDSSDYLELLFQYTVNITIVYSIFIVLFYVFAIRRYLN
jgi:hypothetical protein